MSSCKVQQPLGKTEVRQRAKSTDRRLRRGDAKLVTDPKSVEGQRRSTRATAASLLLR
jgi:hypothetical protein